MAQGSLSTSLGSALAGQHTPATGSLAAENRKAPEILFDVAPACKDSIPQSIRHGNLISLTFLTPQPIETFSPGHIRGCSFTLYKYQRLLSRATLRIWQLRSRFGLRPWMYSDQSFSSWVPSAWHVSTVCSSRTACRVDVYCGSNWQSVQMANCWDILACNHLWYDWKRETNRRECAAGRWICSQGLVHLYKVWSICAPSLNNYWIISHSNLDGIFLGDWGHR